MPLAHVARDRVNQLRRAVEIRKPLRQVNRPVLERKPRHRRENGHAGVGELGAQRDSSTAWTSIRRLQVSGVGLQGWSRDGLPASGSRLRLAPRELRLFEKIRWLQGEDRVLVAQRDDAIVVGVLGKLATEQPVAQLANLVAVKIIHKGAHKLRSGRRTWTNSVRFELRENVSAILATHFNVPDPTLD